MYFHIYIQWNLKWEKKMVKDVKGDYLSHLVIKMGLQ